MNWWPEGAAAKLLADRLTVVPVIGAGISRGAGVPDAATLARTLSSEFGTDHPNNNLFATVDDILADDPGKLARIQSIASEACTIRGDEVTLTNTLRNLVKVPSRFLVTFNYDRLLEYAAGAQGIPYETYDQAQIKEATLRLTASTREKLVILHLHGRADNPNSLVLDGSSYVNLLNNGQVQRFLDTLLSLKTLCLLGFSLDESYLLTHFQASNLGVPRHVLITDEQTASDLSSGRGAISPQRHGIVIAHFRKGQWQELDAFTQALAEPRPRSSFSEVPIRQLEPPLTTYVPLQAVPLGLEPHEKFVADFTNMVDEAAEGGQALRELDPSNMALSNRTLLLGEAGTGKSTTLIEIGKNVNVPECAILIPLPYCPIRPGDVASILWSWLRQGYAFTPQTTISQSDLDGRRFHLLFDGLDELPLNAQDLAAELLVNIAESYPQFRLTIAARPVPSCTRFSDSDWLHLRIQPSTFWATSYLAAHQLTWEDLRRGFPGIEQIGSAILTPLYLSSAIHLLATDRPTDAVKAPGLLIRELIDRTLERESERLLLPLPICRKFLQRIAFAMSLAGRSSFDTDEARRIDLVDLTDIAGSATELIDSMIQRLIPSGTELNTATSQKIIRDAMAAEAVNSLDPSAMHLTEVIFPRFRLDWNSLTTSEGVVQAAGGITLDTVTPHMTSLLCFLLPENPLWRQKAKSKVPQIWARTVPLEASLEERLAAAEYLWRQEPEQVKLDQPRIFEGSLKERLAAAKYFWRQEPERVKLSQPKIPGWLQGADSTLARLLPTLPTAHLHNEIIASASSSDKLLRRRALSVLMRWSDGEIGDVLSNAIRSEQEPIILDEIARLASSDSDPAVFTALIDKALASPPQVAGEILGRIAMALEPAALEQLALETLPTLLRSGVTEPVFQVYAAVRRRLGSNANLRVALALLDANTTAFIDFGHRHPNAAAHGLVMAAGSAFISDDVLQRLTDVLTLIMPDMGETDEGSQEGRSPQSHGRPLGMLESVLTLPKLRNMFATAEPLINAGWSPNPSEIKRLVGLIDYEEDAAQERRAERPSTSRALVTESPNALLKRLAQRDETLIEQLYVLSPPEKAEFREKFGSWSSFRNMLSGTVNVEHDNLAEEEILDLGMLLDYPLTAEEWLAIGKLGVGHEAAFWLSRRWSKSCLDLIRIQFQERQSSSWVRLLSGVRPRSRHEVAALAAERIRSVDDMSGLAAIALPLIKAEDLQHLLMLYGHLGEQNATTLRPYVKLAQYEADYNEDFIGLSRALEQGMLDEGHIDIRWVEELVLRKRPLSIGNAQGLFMALISSMRRDHESVRFTLSLAALLLPEQESIAYCRMLDRHLVSREWPKASIDHIRLVQATIASLAVSRASIRRGLLAADRLGVPRLADGVVTDEVTDVFLDRWIHF